MTFQIRGTWYCNFACSLYGYGTWSVTLRKEYGLMGFENRVLRKIFGYKRAERTGSWRKWQNDELHDFT
jgi:hypothetical protein